MNKSTIKTLALAISLSMFSVKIMQATPENPSFVKTPVAEVTHTYDDAHGRHTVRYEAHPQNTLKKLQTLKTNNRLLALACATGVALGMCVDTFGLLVDQVDYYCTKVIKCSTMSPRELKSQTLTLGACAIPAALTLAACAAGIRSWSQASKAAGMLTRHDLTPSFPSYALENSALRREPLEWFMKSKVTTPIQEHISDIKK